MEINKDVKVRLELDYIDASLVMEAINDKIDALKKEPTIKSICECMVLSTIGKSIVDQVISPEEQEELKKEFHRDKIVLQALKREQEGHGW